MQVCVGVRNMGTVGENDPAILSHGPAGGHEVRQNTYADVVRSTSMVGNS